MKQRVTRNQFMREIMKSARNTWRLSLTAVKYNTLKKYHGYTWSDCLREAWRHVSCRYEIAKPMQPVVIPVIESVRDNYDLSFLYGNGRYNGD